MTVSDTLVYRNGATVDRGWGMAESAEHEQPLDGEAASARRRATRARLMEAASAEIVERGYHATTIEHIAERAGFTRGAFYSNFDSKEQLFAEALDAGRKALLLDLDARLAASELPADLDLRSDGGAVERAVDHILRGLPKEPSWWVLNVEADLLAVHDRDFAARTRHSASRFLDEIGALVERTVGDFGFRLAIEPGQVVRVLFGYFSTALREAVLGGRGTAPWLADPRQTRTVARLLLAMLEPKDQSDSAPPR